MDYFQYDFYGELYASEATKIGKYGFPQLMKENHVPTTQIKPFNYLLSDDKPKDHWIHCFCDDYQFERLWTDLYKYLPKICELQGFISTDFSMYRDYSDDALIWNAYRNRCIAYAVQKAGGTVIPTAGFGKENTWDWCFDGLPEYSSLAVTTNGILNDSEARRIWVGAIDHLVYLKHPSNLIVCGKYPQWLNNKYLATNIIAIPSYSQQWKGRGCA